MSRGVAEGDANGRTLRRSLFGDEQALVDLRWLVRAGWWCSILSMVLGVSGLGSDSGLAFFENRIRPLLLERCEECHGEKKQKGGLRLDHREGWVRGGETGPAVVPGDPASSLLMKVLRHEDPEFRMPPERGLSAEEIAAVERWIAGGAQDPRTGVRATGMGVEEGRKHWAFQPLADSEVPAVRDRSWGKGNIDRFILARLEAEGMVPSPEASRETWIRRVTFDLTGLPPSAEETAAFVGDADLGAWEKVVDRLLASPRYGERWARHWLDLARYADTCGFHNDLDRPYAWRYRDYVIRSFNEDKPYSRFVAEQLAGDEVTGADEETLVATGFCRNGPSNDDNVGNDPEQYRMDQLDDVISTASTVFMGLTLGCARCHDHKTDPLTAADYYGMAAIFNGATKRGVPTKDAKKREAEQEIRYHALVEVKAEVPVMHIRKRGVAKNRGEEVGPSVPGVLGFGSFEVKQPREGAKSSGRRLALAEWLTDSRNALVWRVLANRIWQHHFGRGLVGTPSNFGPKGEAPSHPELLDYLARRLVEAGGRWKPMHREVVLSAAYRQASTGRADWLERDPDNRLLWRVSPRRLEAEAVRDGVLFAAGNLDLREGGEGIKPRIRADLLTASQRNKWPLIKTEGPDHWRRSVYIYVKRQLLMPMMELFDAPTTTDSCAERMRSVVPTQALVLMNDEFVEDQALALARLSWEYGGGVEREAVRVMFRRVLGRELEGDRWEECARFLAERRASGGSEESALADLAHVLFNSSEFIYVE
jgi:hypothetical protein